MVGKIVSDKTKILNENHVLKNKTCELLLEIDRLSELKKENERLRGLLDFEKRIGFNAVSAEIIARNPNDWMDSLIINKGARGGITEDMAICVSGGLLGKVVEVYENTSLIMLITHPGFKAGGMLKDSRINGIIVGSGNGRAKMMYVPIDAEIRISEEVVTSGYSRIFPKGIRIGEIVAIEKSKTGLYKFALIKPSADSFIQEEVLCVK